MPEKTETKPDLLLPLETAILPAVAGTVKVRDYFKGKTTAKIATLFSEFKSRFFDKEEGPVAETIYQKYRLLHISPDRPIIDALGGEGKVTSSACAAIALLERQPDGGPGFLQTNGFANIFYAKDKKGALCAIRLGWASDGWVVDAIAVEDPLAWNGKHEIFCPVAPKV